MLYHARQTSVVDIGTGTRCRTGSHNSCLLTGGRNGWYSVFGWHYLYFCTAPVFLFCSNRRIINVSMMMMMMMMMMIFVKCMTFTLNHGSSTSIIR